MPPESPPPGSSGDWLRRAQSDFISAQGPQPRDVLLEDLCFHAQQAAEKALKAVLVSRLIPPPRTHNIGVLLDRAAKELFIPSYLYDGISLTDYAVHARYPAEREPIQEEEYHEAIRLAETFVQWAESVAIDRQ